MTNFLTKRWNKVDEKCYGDFNDHNESTYGIFKDEYGYRIGRFSALKEEDGLIVKMSKNGAWFADYEKGVRKYPFVNVLDNGDISISLRKTDNGIAKFFFNHEDASFIYTKVDNFDFKQGNGIAYDGLTNTLSFVMNKDDKEVSRKKISKKFFVEFPITYDKPLNLPKTFDETNINFNSGNNFASNICFDNNLNAVGLITFNNNDYAVGSFSDLNTRLGWQIYKENDGSMTILYAKNGNFFGPAIELHKNGYIYFHLADDVNDNYESSMFKFYRDDYDTLEFYDSSSNELHDGDSLIRIRNFNEISFSKYMISEPMEYSDYFYAESLEKKEEPKKEVKKEEKVDPNDPEYQMMSLVGQEDAKKEFTRIRAYIQKNDTQKIYKNIVFFGENGVGKSTVGRLIAKTLYKYHAIKYDKYTEKNARELFNQFTGLTKENMDALLEQGKDGVILIDDFHYLDAMNSSNIKEGLHVLSSMMSNNPNTVFIICDNKYNMTQILENNRDLFADILRFRVNFRDFTREELKDILNIKLNDKGYKIEEDAMAKLLDIIYLSKSYGNNINASAAISILEEIIVIQNVRTEYVDDKVINKDDIDVYIAENDISFIDQKTGYQSDARKKLDELVGLEKIKETVDDLIAYFAINRGKKVDFHMAFTGNPGTGKTEVARIIGKLLRQEGILGTSKFLEVTRRDLVGQYIGQSAILTRDIIDRAMGGVLYIDEAYSLAYGGERDFGGEVVAELLKAMEDRRGEFCVILAGYTSEMKKLFDLNPGFKSRIKFDLEFPDYSDEELEKIARLFLKRDSVNMSDDNIKLVVKLVSIQRNLPNFANVRTLRESLSKIQIKHARRIRVAEIEDDHELTYEDIVGAFSKEEIDNVFKEMNEGKDIKYLDPKVLVQNSEEASSVPFKDNVDFLSESILALKMSGNKNGEGTGFIVTKDGYFLTCAHCVEGAETIKARRRIKHHNRTIDLNYDASVISTDKKADVALCKIEGADDEEFDYLKLAKKGTRLDKLSYIYLMGYPFGVSRFDEMSINEGKITSYQKGIMGQANQINLDIQAKGGNSGSPVIDSNTSEVIGILCGSSINHNFDFTEEINFARSVDYVYEMLEKDYKEKM